jgi:hypothetical protein
VDDYQATYHAVGVCMGARVPVILWGPPGQGKTSVIKDLAEGQGRALEIIMASIREPQDFAGLPVVADGDMRLVPPDWAKRLSADGNGILFLDEVNTAPPSVQAALLRVSLDRVAGDCHLGDGTSVVAAANPPEIAADGWDLAPPLANRFCHLSWELPVSVVQAGFGGRWPRYPVRVADPDEHSRAGGLEHIAVGAFLTARPELLTVVPDSTAGQGRAFPTPRSWDMLATLLAWSRAASQHAEVDRILARGCVGQGAAAEYLVFRDNLDLPDPEAVLADPEGTPIPRRPDKVYVLLGGTMHALRRGVDEQRWNAMGTVLERVARAGHDDLSVSFGREWISLKPHGARVPVAVMRAMVPLLAEAGLI